MNLHIANLYNGHISTQTLQITRC